MDKKKVVVTGIDGQGPGSAIMDSTELWGLTLRQCISALRDMDWGDIEGSAEIQLSDGSWLVVGNVPASDGGVLMGCHQITRYSRDYIIRRYKI